MQTRDDYIRLTNVPGGSTVRRFTTHDNVVLTCEAIRSFLARIGIAGQIVAAPGHSDDSVSLLLDDGSVFTGDLRPPRLAHETDTDTDAIRESWERLARLGAKTLYPGHGPIVTLPA